MFDIFDAISGVFQVGKNAINNRKLKSSYQGIQAFLDTVDRSLGLQHKYEFETLEDSIIARTTINTLIGPRTISISFTNDRIIPIMKLAERLPIDNFTDEQLSSILMTINNVNLSYANCVMAFVSSETENTFDFGLRGVIYASSIHSWSYNSFKQMQPEVALPVNSVMNFIQLLNTDVGNSYLSQLASFFD